MKQFNVFKTLLIVAMLGAASALNAQTISYPLAYGPYTLTGATTATTSNWYKDYVGERLEVTSPSVITGQYTYTTANDGNPATTGNWGGVVTSPLVNVPIYMDPVDSFGGTPESSFTFSAAVMDTIATFHGSPITPHRIFVMWRGPEGAGALDFGCKAMQAQEAGASACVIINEYAGQPPVGMGASTTCVGITIPVFMVGNLDGINISAQYHAGLSTGTPVTMTITPWGAGLTNDLGIIPDGGAFWHDYAVPYQQISSNPVFNQLDGAFIANFGTSTVSDVQLTGTLSFTPTGGSATMIHSDTVVFSAASDSVRYHSSVLSTSARGATYPFTAADSIVAMFAASEYSLATPSTTGQYTLTYNVSAADFIDDDPADNTLTYNFYATDSLYSKGRYDFVNNKPIEGEAEQFGAGDEFIWGPMYFVGDHIGPTLSAVEDIQYFLAQNSSATPPTTVFLTDDIGGNNVFIYQWVDGSGGGAADSLIEDGELQLVSASFYTFNGTTDTSGALLEIKRSNTGTNFTGDANGNQTTVLLNQNTWYYIAVDVPSTTFLGIDDQLNPFPRIYGRAHTSNIIDYNSLENTDTTFSSTPNQINPPAPAGESNVVIDIDSFQLHNMKGLIPSVAMLVNYHPDTVKENVKNLAKSSISLSVYPNPTSDYLDVSVSLDQPAKSVTYEIIDGLGRFVSKQTHYNVQSEVYTINTNNLKPGNYHIAVNANGQLQVRPFTVIR